jgi:two-component system, response regulator PdtaR
MRLPTPFRRTPATAAADLPGAPVVGDELAAPAAPTPATVTPASICSDAADPTPATAQTTDMAGPTAARGDDVEARILVVDDDATVAARLRELLTDFGHVVVGTATSSIHALVLVKALQPDVVVTDLRMPGMSGVELTAELQRLPAPPAVVVVSAYSDPGLQQEALTAGASAYVVKGAPGALVHDAVVAAARVRRDGA